MWPESVERVSSFLRAAAVNARVQEFPEGTPTAQEAARAAGCELGQIVKSLVFVCDGVYVLALGSIGVWMAPPDSGLVVLWQGLNLWAAFVHYAYDGMIWKLRRPETAAALGVSNA